MRYLLILYCLIFFNPIISSAQKSSDSTNARCITDYLIHSQPSESVLGKTYNTQYDIRNQEYHIIPTVVHVIYENEKTLNEEDTLSNSYVKNQIKVLNEDLADQGLVKSNHPASTDTKIRFALAKRDPDGKPTNGINRLQSDYARLNVDQEMRTKNLSRWPSDRYLNIWVVDTIELGRSISGRAKGYTHLGDTIPGSVVDGIVVDKLFFGRNEEGNRGNNFWGKTLTHEVGHYLNLLHTWGYNRGDCQEDDFIEDTPLCKNPFFSPRFNPCEARQQHECPEEDRMTRNYMDYTDEKCQNIFTQGQKRRMRNYIITHRPELVAYPNVYDAGLSKKYDNLNQEADGSQALYPSVDVYPNPLNERYFYLNTFAESQKALDVNIYNSSGQEVAKRSYQKVKTNKLRVDIPNLRPGWYHVKIQFGNKTYDKTIFITDSAE